MNKLKEIFTKIISFLSRVHLGRRMKETAKSSFKLAWVAAVLKFRKTLTSEGKKTNEKGPNGHSTRS